MGVIQLGHRGDGASRICPAEELVLGGDVRQMYAVDSWKLVVDVAGALGRHTQARGVVPGPESRAPCSRSGGNVERRPTGCTETAGAGSAETGRSEVSSDPLTRAPRSQICLISLRHLGGWMDTYPCSSTCPESPPRPALVTLISLALMTSGGYCLCRPHPKDV